MNATLSRGVSLVIELIKPIAWGPLERPSMYLKDNNLWSNSPLIAL